jgi:hypothetical protein
MLNDLKFVFRRLLRNPGFTAVAVLTPTFGTGLGASRIATAAATAAATDFVISTSSRVTKPCKQPPQP